MITARHESVVLVEALCFISLCIDHQRIGTHVFTCLQAPLNRTTDQKSTRAPPPVFRLCRQSAHTETWDRVAWQFLLDTRVKLHSVNLSCAQTVVAQYGAGRIGVDQNPNNRDAFFALLGRKAPEVFIKLSHT